MSGFEQNQNMEAGERVIKVEDQARERMAADEAMGAMLQLEELRDDAYDLAEFLQQQRAMPILDVDVEAIIRNAEEVVLNDIIRQLRDAKDKWVEAREKLCNSRRLALSWTKLMKLQGSMPILDGDDDVEAIILQAGQVQLDGIIRQLNDARDEFGVRENLRKSRLVALSWKKYIETHGPIPILGDDWDLEAIIEEADQEQLNGIIRQLGQEGEIFYDENQRKARNPRQEEEEQEEVDNVRDVAMSLKLQKDEIHRVWDELGDHRSKFEKLMIRDGSGEVLCAMCIDSRIYQ